MVSVPQLYNFVGMAALMGAFFGACAGVVVAVSLNEVMADLAALVLSLWSRLRRRSKVRLIPGDFRRDADAS